MYQALYRKYRPNNFDEVVGQEVIVKSFKNAINNNKLSHAYIFTGPRGTGKTTIAKILGKTVNCLNIKNALPCNQCNNCIQFDSKETTDIIEIDAASNNGVDEIRELKSKINLVPSAGKYKVYIIDEVHMLTVGAFNALLKTLEEPPSHAIFILATTDPHKVPSTILSRCQRFDFKKISEIDLRSRLNFVAKEENIQIEEGATTEIARLSDGGCRDAISLLDQASSYADNAIMIKDIHDMNGTVSQLDLNTVVNDIIEKNIGNVFNLFDFYNEQGKNLVKMTEEVLLFLRNILIYKEVPTYFQNKNIATQPYENISDKIETKKLLDMIELFNETIHKMKNSNNPKLMFELTVIKLINIEKNICVNSTKSVDDSLFIKKSKMDIQNNSNSNIKKKEVKYEINQNIVKQLNYIKNIRVDNTLSDFKKKKVIELKKEYENFRPLILDIDYNEYASLILDGEIKAASDENIIVVFESNWMSDYFNENLIIMETLFQKVYNHPYKIIGVSINEWNEIKKQFNTKQKSFLKRAEDFDLSDLLKRKNNKTDIEQVFGDIIEYS